jgi:hypothetical protein
MRLSRIPVIGYRGLSRLGSGRYQASFTGPDRSRETAKEIFAPKPAPNAGSTEPNEISSGVIGFPTKAVATGPYVSAARPTLRRTPGSANGGRDVPPKHAPAPRRSAGHTDLNHHPADCARLALESVEGQRRPDLHQPVIPADPLGSGRCRSGRGNLAQPCRIPGRAAKRPPEKEIATPKQIADLIEAITPRYRAPVVLAS